MNKEQKEYLDKWIKENAENINHSFNCDKYSMYPKGFTKLLELGSIDDRYKRTYKRLVEEVNDYVLNSELVINNKNLTEIRY